MRQIRLWRADQQAHEIALDMDGASYLQRFFSVLSYLEDVFVYDHEGD